MPKGCGYVCQSCYNLLQFKPCFVYKSFVYYSSDWWDRRFGEKGSIPFQSQVEFYEDKTSLV